MKRQGSHLIADTILLAGAALLFFGCIASSFRSARTLESGQVSVGAGYLQAEDIEESSDPLNLANLDVRASPGRGVDIGLEHTFDFSDGNDARYATLWGDVKVQLTNLDNEPEKFILSTGLLKGYAYHVDAKKHLTSIPLVLSYPVNQRFTPSLMYRHEFVSDAVVPDGDSRKNPRSFFALGFEYALQEPDQSRWTPRLGVSIGTFNSLSGNEGNRGLTLNLGITLDSPVR